MAGVVVVHIHHVLTMSGRARLWHGVHVLAALGMVDMFWPSGRMPVGPGAAELVFGLAAFGLAVLVTVDAGRYGRPVWLWAIAATDMAAMAFMFVLMSTRSLEVVTVLLVVWFIAEAVGWSTGFLAAAAPYGDAMTRSPEPAKPAAGWRSGAAVSLLLRAAPAHRVHSPLSRVSLTVMSVCMAYMLLAMQFGVDAAGSPGMPGMHGM
jgi:hypothetical protein